MSEHDPRLDYPATQRNREPILEVLRAQLRGHERVLEIGSGSGQHAAHFAAHMPGLQWQPSEVDLDVHASIRAWTEGLANVAAPIALDASLPFEQWPIREFDAIFSANVIHISPWEVCLGLLDGAGLGLPTSGALLLYGPFMVGGRHTAASNESFDQSLRARDSRWGVRDLDVVVREAEARGLELVEIVPMPANNLTVVLRRGP